MSVAWTPYDNRSRLELTPTKAAVEGGAVFDFKSRLAGCEKLPLGHDDHVETWSALVVTEDLSNQSFNHVSLDRAAQLFRSGHPEAPDGTSVGEDEERQIAPVNLRPLGIHALKFSPPSDTFVAVQAMRSSPHPCGLGRRYSLLTVSRLRPFARRRFRTRRPFFVLIRTRKPWARARRRLFGWNVRLPFMVSPVQRQGRLRAYQSRKSNRQC